MLRTLFARATIPVRARGFVAKRTPRTDQPGWIARTAARMFGRRRRRLPDLRTTGQSGERRHGNRGGGWRQDSEFNRLDYGSTQEFFDELKKTRLDSKIRGALEFIAGHQVGAALAGAYFRPRGASVEAIRNANYANEAFGLGGGEALKNGVESFEGDGQMESSFAKRFRTILNWQFDGFSVHEELYKINPGADGVARVWLKDLKPRYGGLVDKWHSNPETGEICAVTMRQARWEGGTGTYRLPIKDDPEHDGGEKGSLHIYADIDGSDDPEGRMSGLLRAVSGPRILKEHLWNQLGIGATRWAMPIPKVRVLMQAAIDAGVDFDDLAAARDLAQQAAADFLSDQGAHLTESDLVEISEYGGSFDPAGIVEVINLLNHEQLTALFMQWLAMGVAQSHGSGSAAITHGNAVLQVSRALALRTAEEIELQTVARLLRMNFSEPGPIPELVLPGLEPNPLAASMIPRRARF